VDGDPITLEGFLDDVFGLNLMVLGFDYFHFCLGYFKDPKGIFKIGVYIDEKHFPKHYLFANFQCLRCGLCCKNYECVPVEKEQVEKWKLDNRHDILRFIISTDSKFIPELYPRGRIGCPLCRKVTKNLTMIARFSLLRIAFLSAKHTCVASPYLSRI